MSHGLKELVTSKNQEIQELVTSNKLTSLEVQERALVIAQGLTSLIEPNDMTAWYCKAFRTLGQDKYEQCAKSARKGRSPKSLFGYLLKQEMIKAAK